MRRLLHLLRSRAARRGSEEHTSERVYEGFLDGLFYSYGYYFGQIRIAPQNPQQLYVLGVPVLRSD
ncbi:MAG: hypothetical protein KDB94_07720, partial [Acidobacteria bacterium]|nr:hypothetical protein [Acidobacteriota bacterium]